MAANTAAKRGNHKEKPRKKETGRDKRQKTQRGERNTKTNTYTYTYGTSEDSAHRSKNYDTRSKRKRRKENQPRTCW